MEEQSQAPSIELTEQLKVIHQMRQKFLNDAAQAYTKFLDCIRPLIHSPFHQAQAFIRFDEGHFWLNQSILNAPLNLEPVNPPKAANDSEPSEPPAA